MNLKIYDRKTNMNVEKFSKFSLNLKYDSIGSSFSISFYFDPENPNDKKLAAPSQYNLAKVYHNGELLLTGFIVNQSFRSSADPNLVSFSGYSVPGVLEDCQIPTSTYPLQYDGLTFKEIADKVVGPFAIDIVIDDAVEENTNEAIVAKASKKKTVKAKMKEKITKMTADANTTVKAFLTDLATQKDIILTHDEKGSLVFTKAKTSQKAIFHFEKDALGIEMGLTFNGQGINSHITVLKQADIDGGNAGEYTLINPYVPRGTNSYRPKVVIQRVGDDISTQEVARNILRSQLKNIQVTISINNWDVNGKVIKPNSIVTVTNKELFIYKKTRLFVEEVNYQGDSESLTATLSCVLPEVYNDDEFVNIFV
jgi:prophage tail gpP-like protein